jgi:hypothetical protein
MKASGHGYVGCEVYVVGFRPRPDDKDHRCGAGSVLASSALLAARSPSLGSQPVGPANGRQPARRVAMRTAPVAGSRRWPSTFALPGKQGVTTDESDRSWKCQWCGLRRRPSSTARPWMPPMQDGFSRFHGSEVSRGAAESAERENGHSSLPVGNPAPSGDLPCIHGGCPFSANSAARRAFYFFIAPRLPSNVLLACVGVS